MIGYLDMWTVYDHPKDFPDLYVARRFEIRGADRGGALATGEVIEASTLRAIRHEMRARGLTCIQRHQGDDPVIVEIWL